MSSPNTSAIVLLYCSAVSNRARNGDAEAAGSIGARSQLARASAKQAAALQRDSTCIDKFLDFMRLRSIASRSGGPVGGASALFRHLIRGHWAGAVIPGVPNEGRERRDLVVDQFVLKLLHRVSPG